MTEQEGVIKYQLSHHSRPIDAQINLAELNGWRQIMLRLQLIGQDEHRYMGYGFGNISFRLAEQPRCFLISGTQTGHLTTLSHQDVAIITRAEPEKNRLESYGICKPSSEALTHATVYQQNPDINAVIHVHSPDIWLNTQTLNIASTAKEIPYGTPAMALAVKQLFDNHQLQQQGIISMLGHEDGVISFAGNLQIASEILVESLAKALMLNSLREQLKKGTEQLERGKGIAIESKTDLNKLFDNIKN